VVELGWRTAGVPRWRTWCGGPVEDGGPRVADGELCPCHGENILIFATEIE